MSGVPQSASEPLPHSTIARFSGRFALLSASLPPQPLTSFVGREREQADVSELLRDEAVRLLTVTGPGGVGKTRLAMRLAAALAPEFTDGAAFVSLAAVADPALVAGAIAHEVGTRDTGGQTLGDRLHLALRGRRMLLVLDNFEHLVVAAPEVAHLLGACPGLKVLVTSRVPLHIAGEQEYPVLPLALPGTHREFDSDLAANPAVALFVQRARAVRPEFALRPDNGAEIAAICTRLDGLPLAIELAAARSKVLSPSALLTRLTYPLEVLKGGPRDQPPRLQTMRNAIAWSYQLLPVAEQSLFRRLAVFAGGFTVEAAEAIAGDVRDGQGVLDLIGSLVDASLLRREEGADGNSRFGMLETVLEFAAERLDESDEAGEIRQRHANWCLELAVAAEPPTLGPLDGGALDTLEAEVANLRAALSWLEDQGDTVSAIRLVAVLGTFWCLRGHLGEGRERLERLLPISGGLPAEVRAKALFFAAWLGIFSSDNARAVSWLTESQSLYRDLEDQEGVVATMIALGGAAEYRWDEDEAWARYGEALIQARDLGNQRLIAWCLVNLTDSAYRRGEIDRSADLAEEALALAESIGDRVLRGSALGLAAQVALERGDLPRSQQLCEECLAVSKSLDYRSGLAFALVGLAGVAIAGGQPVRAARLLGAAGAVLEALGVPKSFNHEQQRRTLVATRAALSEEAFAAAWAAGRTLTPNTVLVETAASSPSESPSLARGGGGPGQEAGLSQREMEVLRLLVAGQTDREIGAALFISPRTAQGHVARIFAKLGVSTRTGAVAEAIQSGVLADWPTPR